MPSDRNRTSRLTTEGPGRAPNRAMLRAVGFHDDDFDRPMIGVASLFSDITPCNAHLDRLARKGCEGVCAGGGVPQIFGAPTASDGIMMGHQGMRYSLVSREVIADSLEVVAGGMNHDGLLAFGGCDKNMPGCVMAMAPSQYPQHLRLRRQHPARPRARRRGRGHRVHLRGGRPAAGRQARRQDRPQDRVRGLSRRRLVRRHVHGQHHEFGHRGAGHVAALRRQPAGGVGGQGARVVPGRPGPRPPDREEHPAARHYHPQIAGKRLHDGAGAGRFDQRRAAPDGHRPRSRASSGRWPTSTASGPRFRTWRTSNRAAGSS